MLPGGSESAYPRILKSKEKDLLEFVLPSDRPGYRRYRDLIGTMVVIGEGRRGTGNLVLGRTNDVPDRESPLPPVVAYGAVETTIGTFSVTVRECVGNQIDVEIVSAHGGEVSDHCDEKRRWTYSTWRPGSPSPANGRPVREVVLAEGVVLAISREERRLWVFDGKSGMNLLIPITNFYNELMLHRSIRDPKVALSSRSLFTDLDAYSDEDLRASFIAYNKLKPKVDMKSPVPIPERRGLGAVVKKWFGKAAR